MISSILAAALAAAPATAPDDAQPDDTIVVTASRSGDAVRTDQLGASVTVLDAQAIERRQTRLVSDILRDVPGVAVSRAGQPGGLTQVRIRGSESNHVLVLIDGIEVADPFQGEYDFAGLVSDDAARVEVLRGQQSSLYGSDAIGGVIQYITASGADAPGVRLRADGGSFDTATASARVAGVADRLDYALTGSWNHTGGTPTARSGTRDIGSDIVNASAKLDWSPAETFKLTAVGRYSLTDADQNNFYYDDAANPLFGTIVDSPRVRFSNEAFYGLVRGQLSLLDDRWTNALTAQISDTTRKGFASGARSNGDKGRRYKGSFESSIRFGEEGALRHRLTAAVDVERERYENISPPSPFVFGGTRHTDNVGIVGQYELISDSLSLGGSIRRDENDRFADTTTYRVQGSYAFPAGTRVRGAYGTGVKNPLFYELFGFSDGRYVGNPNLKPEKSKGWEAGVEQALGTAGTIGATYFRSRLENEIFTTYPAPLFVASPDNRATLSRQRGLELFAGLKPTSQLRVDAAYTYLHARENGVREVRRPKHVASVNITGETADRRLNATLTVRYNGAQDDVAFITPPFGGPATVRLGHYTLVNVAAEYRLAERVTLFARVENLLAEDYEEVFSYRTPGRAGYAGIRLAL